MGQPVTVQIDRFLGLRENQSGDLTLEVGELAKCENCRITDNYKIQKRDGYEELFATGSGGAIRGMWYGKVNSLAKFIFARDGNIFSGDLTDGTSVNIGTITDAKTHFFAFSDKLYVQNGYEYKVWNGTGSFTTVVGYTPTVFIGTPPAGGGTAFEEANTLNGQKKQSFNGDATSIAYQLAELAITSLDSVVVDGVTLTPTTDYTVNLTTGVITPVPATKFTVGTDNVVITWTGAKTTSFVTPHKFSVLFGGQNDTRVFMIGNKNKLIYSEIANGLPSAEYFPESNSILVSSDNYDITGLTKQYGRLVIHKENETHTASYEITSLLGTIFSTTPLNDVIGNIAFGETPLILNNPFVITGKGVYQFVGSNVRDERNAVLVSERVQLGLDALDLTTAITFDFEKKFEYWLAVGSTVYIYNYKVDAWYKYILTDTPTKFLEIDGEAYFGTSTGSIIKFVAGSTSDDGEIYNAEWETSFLDYGANWLRKFLTYSWFTMNPQSKSICEITWQTDRGVSSVSYILSYNLMDFSDVDFADFSFDTNYNPQPYRKKLKAKKFSVIKIIGKNETVDKKMTILSMSLPAVTGGQVK